MTKSPLTRLIQVSAVVVAAVLWAAGSVPAQAGVRIQGPTVVSGWKDGPVAIVASSTLSAVAALPLGAGTWVAWAKLFVTNHIGTSSVDVRCRLGANNLFFRPGHSGTVNVLSSNGVAELVNSMTLSTEATFGSGGGKVEVRCAAEQAGMSANWIKIMAMRVGTLTRVQMGTGDKTTLGVGSPQVVVGVRDDPIRLTENVITTVGKLSLGPGRWAVRTSFTIVEDDLPFFNCRLLVNGVSADHQSVSPDQPSLMVVMDTAVASSSSVTVKATCKGTSGPASFGDNELVQGVRITAVKLGTLVTYDSAGDPHSHGSGVPKARFKTVPDRVLTTQQWVDVAWLDVEAGAWMILAKAAPDAYDQPVICQLTALPDYDQTDVGVRNELGVPFAVVHRFLQAGRVRLRCRAPELTSEHLAYVGSIRLTAIKLGSLQNVPL